MSSKDKEPDEDIPLLDKDEMRKALAEFKALPPAKSEAEHVARLARLFRSLGPAITRRAFREAFGDE
jgi:hypothetical protein